VTEKMLRVWDPEVKFGLLNNQRFLIMCFELHGQQL